MFYPITNKYLVWSWWYSHACSVKFIATTTSSSNNQLASGNIISHSLDRTRDQISTHKCNFFAHLTNFESYSNLSFSFVNRQWTWWVYLQNVTISTKYIYVFLVKYQDTWSLPNNLCSINYRRFLPNKKKRRLRLLMCAIVVGYPRSILTYRLSNTFLNWTSIDSW